MNYNLIKKLLLWIGIAIITLSTIVLIFVNIAPYKLDSPYKYESYQQSGDFVEASITLNKYGIAIIETKINGIPPNQNAITTFNYLVRDGILYQHDNYSNYRIKGTVNASKIILVDDPPSSLVFENEATVTTNKIFISLLILGILSVSGYMLNVYLKKVDSEIEKNRTLAEQKTELLDKID